MHRIVRIVSVVISIAVGASLHGCSAAPSDRDASTGPRPDGAISDPDSSAVGPDGSLPGDRDASITTDARVDTDAGSVTSYAFCRIACTAPADCATPSVELYDAAHYACESGLCRWRGCDDDAECRAAFSSTGYACRAIGGLPQCIETCTTTAECGSGTAAFGPDNYACTAGVCEYRGCNDDAECSSTFASPRYVCRRARLPDTGVPIPTAERNCVLGCTTPADCSTASGAFDADNYECTEGSCVYTGCNGDSECRSSFASDRYVCR